MYMNKPLSYEKIFGLNVKVCREAKGLSQKELAEEILGYPEELIQKVEDGIPCNCSIDFYVSIANFFKVPLESILTNQYFSIPTYKE